MALSVFAGCAAPAAEQPTQAPQATEEPVAAPTEAPAAEAPPAEEPAAPSTTYTVPTGDWVVGLSNSYYGNTWRKQMVDSFTKVAEEAKAAGYIKDYVIQNGDGSVNAQIAQINSFILEGVDVICINAASATALNSVIDKAVAAGIPVVAFDSTVDNANAYCMDFDFTAGYYLMGDYLANNAGYKGNIVVVRGVSGSAPEEMINNAYKQVIDEHPDLKVIATVLGEADSTVAQEEFTKILPSLDKVDMIFNQGGDTYGIIQAFEQAGLAVPPMSGDNSAEFINWWLKQDNYDTMSLRAAPACGSAAFWTALNILNGEDVPKKMDLALSIITKDMASQFTNMEAGSIAGADWTNQQVMDQIIIPSRTK
ncbi:MAG TPA: substrate-binding domain-containing protein [Feifaniaceae bacterium]|nr:substrate-binding domain-containing protein [Feifaniaceae bacterium]